MKNYKWIASLVIVCALAMPQRLMALGECGLSCCIASAGTSGIGLASNFGLSVQYEYSNMGRLMNGKDEVSVKQVLDKHFPATGMARYMVPTEHIMQKISVSGAYTVNDKLQILGVVPFVINDMKMKMRMRMNPMMPMMIMERDTVMDTISGLGDISLIAQWNVFQDQEIRPTSRLTLGGGVKLATGANDAESSPGVRIHAVMQAGTGSTDPILTLNYMKAFYPLVFTR